MLGLSPAFHSVTSRETEHAQRGLGTRLLSSIVVRAVHQHDTGVGLIFAGGPIVDEFFSTVPGLKGVIFTRD